MSRVVALIGLMLALFSGSVVAQEAATEGTGSSLISMVVILVVFVGVFYFLLIRPQRKRAAKHEDLVSNLKRGDKVITAGGIHGEIDSIGDTSAVLTLEEGVKIRVAKSSIANKITK